MRVLIADDHPLVRDAMRLLLSRVLPALEVMEADSADQLLDQLKLSVGLDMLLLDLNIPGAGGFSTLALVKHKYPTLPVVVVSGLEDRTIAERALGHGAAAFVPKSAAREVMQAALRHVLDGGIWAPSALHACVPEISADEREAGIKVARLTPQQYRIATLLAGGLLNKQIAYELGIAESTVKVHMASVFRCLAVRNRVQVALLMRSLAIDHDRINSQDG